MKTSEILISEKNEIKHPSGSGVEDAEMWGCPVGEASRLETLKIELPVNDKVPGSYLVLTLDDGKYQTYMSEKEPYDVEKMLEYFLKENHVTASKVIGSLMNDNSGKFIIATARKIAEINEDMKKHFNDD